MTHAVCATCTHYADSSVRPREDGRAFCATCSHPRKAAALAYYLDLEERSATRGAAAVRAHAARQAAELASDLYNEALDRLSLASGRSGGLMKNTDSRLW